MKSSLYNLSLMPGRLNQRHVWRVGVVLSLALFGLEGGVPGDFGGH